MDVGLGYGRPQGPAGLSTERYVSEEETTRGRGAPAAIVLLSLTTAFLTIATNSAAAQGCTEQLSQDFLSGWSHDLPKLLPLFTDDVVYEDKTVGTVLHGKEKLRDFAQGRFKAFPDLKFTRTAYFIGGDRAAIEWVGTGTHKGDVPGNARVEQSRQRSRGLLTMTPIAPIPIGRWGWSAKTILSWMSLTGAHQLIHSPHVGRYEV